MAGAATIPVRRSKPFPTVPESVSIVIPTLNGGALFRRVLAAARAQVGLGGLEIIVIDSGSTDGTPEAAAEAGARVVRIAAEEFGHGRTRNRGGELATGDVLVNLVQDAILLGRDSLRTLVLELRSDESLAAVSARQIPRSDADLYGAFVVWAHHRAVYGARRRRRNVRLDALTPLEWRALAGVDNVCAAFRRDAWEELRFSDLRFAEDLDFGIRAVRRGWSLRLSSGAAVAHSHTRGAAYHARRSLADRLHVAPLVGDDRLARVAVEGPAVVRMAARSLAAEVCGALISVPTVDTTLVGQLRAVRAAVQDRADRHPPIGELADLAEFLADVDGRDTDHAERLLRADLVAALRWPPLLEFAALHHDVGRDHLAAFVGKLTGTVFGRALGDAMRRGADAASAERLVAGV